MNPMRDQTTWLQGGRLACLRPPIPAGRRWTLVLLGPPRAGKSVQAGLLASMLGACPLSTGDVFRAARARLIDPAMRAALQRIDDGELVADDLVLAMLRERRECLRCRGGFLLDGFPLTMPQSIALDGLLDVERQRLDAVIHYQVPAQQLLARCVGRRICPRCHAVYHLVSAHPAAEGVCDRCGHALTTRSDDEPRVLRRQWQVYAETTVPVLEHYERRGLLVPVYAGDDPARVLARTLARLAARGLMVPPLAEPLFAESEPGHVERATVEAGN